MILVTGASGMLGANLSFLAWERFREDVIGVDLVGGVSWQGIKSVILNLTERENLKKLLHHNTPSWIVHCAALTNVDLCQREPETAHQLNVDVTESIASIANDINSRVVYISTDSVFDGVKGNYSEGDTPAPVNVYAESKMAGEEAVIKASEENLVIRTNIYGWNMQDKMSLAEWILDRLQSGQEVPGFTDVIFNPIFVNDLCKVIFDMMELELNGVFHVTGSQSCSKFEFAVELANMFDFDSSLVCPVSIDDSHLEAPRPKNTSLQTAKACCALQNPLPDLRSGLVRFKELSDSGFVARLKAFGG